MKRTIYLHGYLSDLHPEPIELEAETVAEAIRGLQQLTELRPKDGEPHVIQIDGVETDVALMARGGPSEIHVRPLLGGAGGNLGANGGAFLKILVGIALVAVAIINPALSLAGGLITSGMLLSAGGLLVTGGLLQLLMPSPEDDQEQSSKYLGASQNTVNMGTPIPLAYGTVKLSGHYISFDVDAKRVASSDEIYVSQPDEYHRHDTVLQPSEFAVLDPIYDSSTPGGTPESGWLR